MNVIEKVVKRPVAVLMFYLVILFIGVMSARRLPLELIPNVDFPKLYVNANWGRASPEMVEKRVTSKIEGVCNTIPGVRKISSTSSEGNSIVTMEFNPKTKMNYAVMELREKLNLLKDELPANVTTNIRKYVPREFEKGVFLSFRVTGNMTLVDLRKFAINEIRNQLLGIDGVADVEVLGGLERQIRIIFDRDKIKSFGLHEELIQYSLYRLSLDEYIGYVEENGVRYFVLIDDKLTGIEQVRNHIVDNRYGRTVRVKDFAEVYDTYTEPRSISRINGNPSIVIEISKESGTNTIKVRDAVFAKIEELKPKFPPDMALINDEDSSLEIRNELDTLSFRAVFSIIVIFVILFVFIRNVRIPLIILSTIFFSELLALIFFYWAGIGLNLLTLAGLALGFGMIVDNSIVVIDNIFRYREKKVDRITASERGTREVALPIVASTLTTVVVFLPFLYLTGDRRAYYLPFAGAVALSLIASLLVAFTFIPSLAARFFGNEKAVTGKKSGIVLFITDIYRKFLKFIIRFKWAVLVVVLLIFGFSYHLFDKYVTKGRIWRYGSSKEILTVYINLPKGSEIETVDEIIGEFEKIALKDKDKIKLVSTNISPEYAQMRIEFPDSVLMSAYPYNLKSDLIYKGAQHAGINIGVYGFGEGVHFSGLGGSSYSARLTVKGYNYEELRKIAEDIGERLKRHRRVDNVETSNSRYSFRGSTSETILKIDREKLAKYDLSVQYLLSQVSRYLKGTFTRSTVKLNNEEISYEIKVKGFDRFEMRHLNEILVFTSSGERVRLSEVISIDEKKVMGSIEREDQQYARYIRYEFKGPYKMHETFRDAVLENTKLPPGYSLETGSSYFMGTEEKQEIYFVILIAVLLVYMTTAALYESFLLPLVVILTVPMALIGVFLTFFLLDKGFDRSAYIGVVLLAGIVVNNSIILVDHINRLRRSGMGFIDAVIQGAIDRVRPILMTSTTTIFAMIPLVLTYLGKTESESLWQALSLSTIGGLISATPLTLTVIPILIVIIRRLLREHRTT